MKNPAEIAGTRYKNEKLMSRMQNTDRTSRCFAQSENIKRQSLITPEYVCRMWGGAVEVSEIEAALKVVKAE